MLNKKGFIFFLSFSIIIGSLFISNKIDAESLEKDTPVSNNENLDLLIPTTSSINKNSLEVKPIIPKESKVYNISSDFNKTVIDGVLEEELTYEITFSDNEGKPLSNKQEPIISPFGLVGTKDRRVQNTNTTIPPYNAISYLFVRWPDGKASRCTGFIIDRDSVLTAGHCVYSKGNGGWATGITVRPGANGSNNFPYGAFESENLYSVTGWTEHSDRNYDYAVINISGTFPSTIGTFGYGVATNSNFGGEFARVTGYPADRDDLDANKPLYTQWYHSGTIKLPLLNSRAVYYTADTSRGQSGSPVYIPGENIARAIHTSEHKDNLNRGTRITKTVFANIQNWAAQ